MGENAERRFVSRAGNKLDHALSVFGVDPRGWTCADLGCSSGGFVDCLLRRGATKVYAVDRGFGVLDYRIRSDSRVIALERADALQVRLPESVRLVTLDLGWTRQRHALPAAARLTSEAGHIIALIKPQYEAPPDMLLGGVLQDEVAPRVLETVRPNAANSGLVIVAETESPIRGRGGNREYFWHLRSESGSGVKERS